MATSTNRQRPLIFIFWGVFAVIAVSIIGVLQYLGPPAPALPAADRHPGAIPSPAVPAKKIAAIPAKPILAEPAPANAALAKPALAKAALAKAAPQMRPAAPPMAVMGVAGTLPPGAPIPAPNAALLGPSATNPSWLVPRIGPTGLAPMQAYAANAPADAGPQVAVLVAGIGNDDSQSQEAVTTLPAAISMAISPYAQHIADVAALARASGHEILLALPMQEADPATQNAGNEALVLAGPITQNQPMLDWSLSQFQGYAGVTDAIGATQGAGFMNNANAKSWMLQEIADKGLLFIDARRTGLTPYAWNRTADVVIDPVLAPASEAAQLAELTADARLQGSAMGILLDPAPAALQTLWSWTQTLRAQGIMLVPVSALVLPPNAAAVTTAAAVTPAGAKP